MRREDLPYFLEIRNSIRNSLHDPTLFSLQECQIWFEINQRDYWLIIDKDKIIGYFRFEVDVEDRKTGIIGMDLDPAFHGLGYAKLLYRKFCDETLPKYAVSYLRLRVLKSNTRAQSLYATMGMTISNESSTDYEMEIGVEQLVSNLQKM